MTEVQAFRHATTILLNGTMQLQKYIEKDDAEKENLAKLKRNETKLRWVLKSKDAFMMATKLSELEVLEQ